MQRTEKSITESFNINHSTAPSWWLYGHDLLTGGSFLLFLLFSPFLSRREGERERERRRKEMAVSPVGSFPKWLHQLGWAGEGQEPTASGPSMWVQGPKRLDHTLLLFLGTLVWSWTGNGIGRTWINTHVEFLFRSGGFTCYGTMSATEVLPFQKFILKCGLNYYGLGCPMHLKASSCLQSFWLVWQNVILQQIYSLMTYFSCQQLKL